MCLFLVSFCTEVQKCCLWSSAFGHYLVLQDKQVAMSTVLFHVSWVHQLNLLIEKD